MLTIGDKIRFFRTKRLMTQRQLAELSGIHPVSIRKYETNKMVPQAPHIEKIADALSVHPYALTGSFDNPTPPLENEGNLASLLIILHRSGVLRVEGERDEGYLLKADTVRLIPDPMLEKYFSISASDATPAFFGLAERGDQPLHYFSLKMKDTEFFNDFLKWEATDYILRSALKENEGTTDSAILASIEHMREGQENVELKLQSRYGWWG